MIKGLGSDIVELDRIAKVFNNYGVKFAQKILTDIELKNFEISGNKVRFLAKKFAAKESAAKALGTGFSQGVSFKDFEITNDSSGKPILTIENKAKEIFNSFYDNSCYICNSYISISDEKKLAMAVVVFEVIKL